MARGRMISRSIFESESLAGRTLAEHYIFIGLILISDDEGRFSSNAELTKAILTANCSTTSAKPVRYRGFIEHLLNTYTIQPGTDENGRKCWQFTNFRRYQKLKKHSPQGELEEELEEEEELEGRPNGLPDSAPTIDPVDWSQQLQLWNFLAAEHGLPLVRGRLNDARRKSFRARFKQAGSTEEFWKELTAAVARRKAWARDARFPAIDQALAAGTFTKLIEGNYDENENNPESPGSVSELDRQLAEELSGPQGSPLTDDVFHAEGQS